MEVSYLFQEDFLIQICTHRKGEILFGKQCPSNTCANSLVGETPPIPLKNGYFVSGLRIRSGRFSISNPHCFHLKQCSYLSDCPMPIMYLDVSLLEFLFWKHKLCTVVYMLSYILLNKNKNLQDQQVLLAYLDVFLLVHFYRNHIYSHKTILFPSAFQFCLFFLLT